MNVHNFARMGDRQITFQIDNFYSYRIEILSGSCKKTRFKYYHQLIRQIADQLSIQQHVVLDPSTLYFKFCHKIYKLSPIQDYSKAICAFFSSFFKNTINPLHKDYELSEVNICQSFVLKENQIIDLNTLKESSFKSFTKQYLLQSPNDSSFFSSFINSKLFSDPYTVLATLAFQKYEEYYDAHDGHNDENFESRYMLIQTSNSDSLKLKLVSKEKNIHHPSKVETLKHYRSFLYAIYGEAKIQYIEKCYGIDFDKIISHQDPLTPEIIYRVNIGLGNLEIQEVEQLLHKLYFLSTTLKEICPNDLAQSALPFLQMRQTTLNLTLFEIRGIYNSLLKNHKNPNLVDLIQWITTWDKAISVQDLTQKQFNQLIEILSVTAEEREAQYTGRKICLPIQSSYTTASIEKFKPWVDQQELLQIFSDLQKNQWDHFYEKLSHIVCKKHLVRMHPTEGYRVGALIPAPKANDGTHQWYKVESFINNGRGIVSHTLTSACHNQILPDIKLYRSTSSSPYALDGPASIKNNLNPINPPGYEGSYLNERYEEDFYGRRTIPVWVGYLNQAHIKLQKISHNQSAIQFKCLQEIYRDLLHATEELQTSHIKWKLYLNLPALIKKYDAELLDMIQNASQSLNISSTEYQKFLNILMERKQQFRSLNFTFLAEQKKDAQFLVEIISRLPHSKQKILLINLLKREIIQPFRAISQFEEGIELKDYSFSNEIKDIPFKELVEISLHIKESLNLPNINSSDIFNDLLNWNGKLSEIAKSLNEDMESKLFREIVLAGHSLGGACAQQSLIQYFIRQGRIPLPGQKISLRLFDEPGIRYSDNEAFKKFGNKHAALLTHQKSKFLIIRRHEAGDFFVTGGEVHLGATYSEEEERKVSQWLTFDASVQFASMQTFNSSISYSLTAHGTQFETGRRLSFRSSKLESSKKTEISNDPYKKMSEVFKGDFTRIWYSSSIQGMFNKGTKSQHWPDIKSLWKIPLDTITGEGIRSQTALMMRTEYMMLKILNNFQPKTEEKNCLHGNWKKYCDDRGVFAIDEHGIMSSDYQKKIINLS